MTVAPIESSPIPPLLAKYVRVFVTRSRKLATAEAAAWALAFMIVWTLLWALVDRLVALALPVRSTLLIAQLAAAVIVLVRPMRQLMRRDVPWQRATAEIERREPVFAGALQTAISQLLAPTGYRGSSVLVNRLVEEAEVKAAERDAGALLPLAPVLKPLAVALSGLLLAVALAPVSWMDLPRLLERELLPLSNAAAVTTTRLNVRPGSVEMAQGDPLTVIVHAYRLGDAQPVFRWRGDDPLWSSAVMTPDGTAFSYKLASVDHAFQYQISGGDAVSPTFDVRVLPRPAVSEFRIRYTYPSWTDLLPAEETNTSGVLEGPQGTTAEVSIVATEPLLAAACAVDGTRIETTATVDPSVRRVIVPMKRSGPWQFELISARNVHGNGPSAMTIHAFPPQAPVVRLLLSDDEAELRLHPRDMLTLRYEASDEYALNRIAANIQVNAASPREMAIALGANPRTQTGSFDVDLAQLAVSLGDVVTIVVTAEDKGGMRGASQPCRVIVSPRSIDLNAQQRLSELHEAARLAGVLTSETAAASKAVEESPAGDAKEARDERIAPHLAVADSAAGGLSRTLLGATTHSDGPELSMALGWMMDATQRAASGLEQTDATVMVDTRDALRDRLNRAAGPAQGLPHALESLWRGERAAQLRAEMKDSAAAETRAAKLTGPPAETLRRSAQRAREDQAAGCVELGIDPHAADLTAQLQRRIDEAAQTVRQFGPIDFAAAAAEWEQAGATGATELVARLIVASQAEAVRPEGDFVWARDLQLAARAARRIDTGSAATTAPAGAEQPRHAYPLAIGAVQRIHELRRARTPTGELGDAEQAAEEARLRLRRWAGEENLSAQIPDTSSPTTVPASMPSPTAADLDLAALEAAAAETQQKYDAMMRIDHSSSSPAATMSSSENDPDREGTLKGAQGENPTAADVDKFRRAVASARGLERLTAEERQLRSDTEKGTDAQSSERAERQAELTDAIQKVREQSQLQPAATPDESDETSEGDTREQAMNAIRSAQERLAEMPPQISNARETADARARVRQRAEQARQLVDTASQDEKAAIEEIADEARQSADWADERAASANGPVSPDVAANIAAGLRRFAPETSPAIETLEQQLSPSLSAMRQADSTGESADGERNAQAAKQAVVEAQRRLAAGLQTLLLRDPLTTAKWFSAQAGKSLSKQPGNRAAAIKLQRGAAAALAQAWDDAIHQAAAQRIAGMPSLAGLLRLYSNKGTGEAFSAPGAERPPAPRRWGRLLERAPDDLSAPSRDADPVEYQDALRVYFRALAREREGGGR